MAMLLVLSVFTACDDDDSDGSSSDAHYMTTSELATITSIFRLVDDLDLDDYAIDYIYDDEDNFVAEYRFIDSDGDEEYDDGEQLIYYCEVTNPDEDDDNIYAKYCLYNYSDDESGNSLYGTQIYTSYENEESGSYVITVEYDYTATVSGVEHTLVMTVEQTSSDSYTDTDVVLDGVTLYGFEDYMNVLSYY